MAATRRCVAVTLAILLGAALTARAQEPQHASPPLPASACEAQGFLIEPDPVRRAALFGDRHLSGGELGEGLYVDFKGAIPGSGWIAGGPGYRRWYRHDTVMVDASGTFSWRAYKTAQTRVEWPQLLHSRLLLGSQVRWQDFMQVRFFGEGPDTLLADRSEYRIRTWNLVGYATLRPLEKLRITGTLGILSPEILPKGGTFESNYPDARLLFSRNPVFSVADQPTFLHGEVSAVADTRDFPGHPTRGTVLRAAASRYADRDTGLFTFHRYEGEAAQFVPLLDSRAVIAVHGWLVASDTEPGRFVPFYLQPALGGGQSLRSYPDFRFRDRHLVNLNAELRLALMTHVDVAVLFDAGNVAARVADLDFGKRSYGAGIRLHSRRQTFARLDVAHGGDGWRALFALSDPLSLSRLSRRTATAPFVP